MVAVELDDADRAALIALLKQAIAADPFPMSQRNRTFKAIIAKLDPPREASTECVSDKCRDELKPAQPAEDCNRQLHPRCGHGPLRGRGQDSRGAMALWGVLPLSRPSSSGDEPSVKTQGVHETPTGTIGSQLSSDAAHTGQQHRVA